MFKEEMENVVI